MFPIFCHIFPLYSPGQIASFSGLFVANRDYSKVFHKHVLHVHSDNRLLIWTFRLECVLVGDPWLYQFLKTKSPQNEQNASTSNKNPSCYHRYRYGFKQPPVFQECPSFLVKHCFFLRYQSIWPLRQVGNDSRCWGWSCVLRQKRHNVISGWSRYGDDKRVTASRRGNRWFSPWRWEVKVQSPEKQRRKTKSFGKDPKYLLYTLIYCIYIYS